MQGKFEIKEDTRSSVALTKQVTPNPAWLFFGDLFIHPTFFERGIVVVSPTDRGEAPGMSDALIINDREFYFHETSGQHKKPPGLKSAQTLLSSLVAFALTHKAKIQPLDEAPCVLVNRRRREETFLPLIMGEEDERLGCYVFPWISKSSQSGSSDSESSISSSSGSKPFDREVFSGFSQFVTAGCMFGASLRAATQEDDIELIDHHLSLRPGQIIGHVYYDETIDSPYESALFDEFEKTCLLINAFADSHATPPRLLYHLPAYDYVLFGIKFFVRYQMTLDALDSFIKAIFVKQKEHISKISALCSRYGIEVKFVSPFDNLFGPINERAPTDSVLGVLGIASTPMFSSADATETSLVKLCLSLLKRADASASPSIWQDFVAIAEKDGDYTFEDLLKHGNALVLALASIGKDNYKTCSLLPLSEKQIQVGYEASRKKYKACFPDNVCPYPPVVNLTLLEPMVTYSPTTKGLLFYFSECQRTLSQLIQQKKIMRYAAKNIGLFACHSKVESDGPVDLHTLLADGGHLAPEAVI